MQPAKLTGDSLDGRGFLRVPTFDILLHPGLPARNHRTQRIQQVGVLGQVVVAGNADDHALDPVQEPPPRHQLLVTHGNHRPVGGGLEPRLIDLILDVVPAEHGEHNQVGPKAAHPAVIPDRVIPDAGAMDPRVQDLDSRGITIGQERLEMGGVTLLIFCSGSEDIAVTQHGDPQGPFRRDLGVEPVGPKALRGGRNPGVEFTRRVHPGLDAGPGMDRPVHLLPEHRSEELRAEESNRELAEQQGKDRGSGDEQDSRAKPSTPHAVLPSGSPRSGGDGFLANSSRKNAPGRLAARLTTCSTIDMLAATGAVTPSKPINTT